jgi:Icc-related predicted phosphoesterase
LTAGELRSGLVRLVAISDTHMAHDKLALPPCEILLHAGDFSRRGTEAEIEAFLRWLSEQRAQKKVLIAGNHDFFCEREPAAFREMARRYGVTYLEDEGVELFGLSLWGSPQTPRFHDMAFNRDRGPELRGFWQKIPPRVDILITHGPPYRVGDKTILGVHVGDEELLSRVRELAPRLHVFGHIHEAYGEHRCDGIPTRFINAATRRVVPVGLHEPVVLDW